MAVELHGMNGHGVDGVNGHGPHGPAAVADGPSDDGAWPPSSFDEPGELRARLEQDLRLAQERLVSARARADERADSLKDALRRELAASRARVAEMDRAHDERIAEIRRRTDAELARIVSAVDAKEDDR